MIIADFLILDETGLYCRIGNFYIDPQKPVHTAVISHAHGDHAVRGNGNIYCTAATAAIMQLRYKKNAGTNFFLKNYRNSYDLNGVRITFIPAGHILGSAQILLQYDGVRYLYTGDFKLQHDATCEPFEFETADVLITETTFADPEVSHPNPEEEIKKLAITNHNILLGAYSLGKSQRIINLVQTQCPDKMVLVHHTILPINKLYEDHAFPPGRYEPYNRKLMKNPGQNYIYIVPPLTFDSYFRAGNVLRAFASGWKRLQNKNHIELLISDHADWQDVLMLIDKVQPKEIWTLHGDGQHLKKHFEGNLLIKILN